MGVYSLRLLGFLVLFAVLSCAAIAADEPPIAYIHHPDPEKQITGLKWKSDDLRAEGETDADFIEVVFEGRYDRPGWVLYANGVQVPVSSGGDFIFRITVPEQQAVHMVMNAVGPSLEREQENLSIRPWNWRGLPAPSFGKRWALIPSLGFTMVNYKETFVPDFSETALTLKLSAAYVLWPPRWSLGMTTYYTVLPLSTSDPARSLRFLGVNARIGYLLPFRDSKWKVIFMVGGYFTTTFDVGRFGFKNLQGPQVFPVFRFDPFKNDNLMAYFKYSPITEGFGSFTFSSYEMAAGASWTHLYRKGKSLSVTFDYANMDLNYRNVIFYKVNTMSFGVGYGF